MERTQQVLQLFVVLLLKDVNNGKIYELNQKQVV